MPDTPAGAQGYTSMIFPSDDKVKSVTINKVQCSLRDQFNKHFKKESAFQKKVLACYNATPVGLALNNWQPRILKELHHA